ncbi:hypothetical protein AGMMS50293_15980 [Spirochaetia bacterium]|nr:hypothetical protein AGMMS50293_15980 [Spirochaetia bacterium]
MGKVVTEITLTNAADRAVAGRGLMPESEIRQVTVSAIVDTGASTIIINEELQRQLGLEIEGTRAVRLGRIAWSLCDTNWATRLPAYPATT